MKSCVTSFFLQANTRVASASELDKPFWQSSMTIAESEATSLILYCHGLPIQYQHNQIEVVSLSCTPSLFELLVVAALFVSGHLFFATLFWTPTLHDPFERDFHRWELPGISSC